MKLEFPQGDAHFAASDWDNYQLLQYTQLVQGTTHRGLALDIGAHAGIMTRRMSRDFERVVSFEPIHHQLLRSNTEDLHNVTIEPYAVGNTNTTVGIYIGVENSGDCRVTKGIGDQQVEQIRLDDTDYEGVAAIKMDIQGSELSALQGAEQTILRDWPALMLELEPDDPNKRTVLELLKDWGYVCRHRRSADHIFLPV